MSDAHVSSRLLQTPRMFFRAMLELTKWCVMHVVEKSLRGSPHTSLRLDPRLLFERGLSCKFVRLITAY
jgi:hypothetical protein